MRYDFQRFMKTALVDDNYRSCATVIAAIYFRDIKIQPNAIGNLVDYHTALFNRLPLNQYSGLLEVSREINNQKGIDKFIDLINNNTDRQLFFEIAKSLKNYKQEFIEQAAEKTIACLKEYLDGEDIEIFLSLKILNEFSNNFPKKVESLNSEMEDLVRQPSKIISSLSILTLLQTGSDVTVKRLASKIEPLMNSLSNSYKILIVETMDKLSNESKDEFAIFKKNAIGVI